MNEIYMKDTLFIKNNKVLFCTGEQQKVVVPDGISEIGKHAFEDIDTVTEVILPDSCVWIGEDAFMNCANLRKIRLSPYIRSIGYSAFEDCGALRSFDCPDSLRCLYIGVLQSSGIRELNLNRVENVSGWALYRVRNLENLEIPESVESIDPRLFEERGGPRKVILKSDMCSWEFLNNILSPRGRCEWVIYTGRNHNHYGKLRQAYGEGKKCRIWAENVPIPLLPQAIRENAAIGFACMDAKGIRMNPQVRQEGLSWIRTHVDSMISLLPFEEELRGLILAHGYLNLENLDVLEKSVQEIGDSRLEERIRTEITAYLGRYYSPEQQEARERRQMEKLVKEAEIIAEPDSDKARRRYFTPDLTRGLAGRYLGPEEEATWPDSVNGQPIHGIRDYDRPITKSMRDTLVKAVIPEGYTSIGSFAFAGCKKLKSVQLPSTLREIGSAAFEGCKALSSISVPGGVEKISGRMLKGCVSLMNVTLPPDIRRIDSEAFSGCRSLRKLELPPRCECSGESALADTGITDLVIGEEGSLDILAFGISSKNWKELKEIHAGTNARIPRRFQKYVVRGEN